MSPVQQQWLETTALDAWSSDTTIGTIPILTWGGAAATPLLRGIWPQIHTGKGAKAPATIPRKVIFHRRAIQ